MQAILKEGVDLVAMTPGRVYAILAEGPDTYKLRNDRGVVIYPSKHIFEVVDTVAEYEEHKLRLANMVSKGEIEAAAQYIAHQVHAPEVQALLIYSLATRKGR